MATSVLPSTIEQYFASKGGADAEASLSCFTNDATIWDNGEDLELHGILQIQEWMRGKLAEYKLTSEVRSHAMEGEESVVRVVVSGDFPGSPYEFVYRFKLRDDKIAGLVIDPIGPADA